MHQKGNITYTIPWRTRMRLRLGLNLIRLGCWITGLPLRAELREIDCD